jgi:hypothetical protein
VPTFGGLVGGVQPERAAAASARPLVPGCLQPAPQQHKELEKQLRWKLHSTDGQIELEL